MADEFIKIAVLENQFEGQLLDTVLSERGIPHLIRSYHDAAYDGLFQMQKGWGCMVAREESREEILELLEDIRKDAGLEGEEDSLES